MSNKFKLDLGENLRASMDAKTAETYMGLTSKGSSLLAAKEIYENASVSFIKDIPRALYFICDSENEVITEGFPNITEEIHNLYGQMFYIFVMALFTSDGTQLKNTIRIWKERDLEHLVNLLEDILEYHGAFKCATECISSIEELHSEFYVMLTDRKKLTDRFITEYNIAAKEEEEEEVSA